MSRLVTWRSPARAAIAAFPLAALLVLTAAPIARAATPTPATSPAALLGKARRLLDEGAPREALTLLKANEATLRGEDAYPFLRARAYLAEDNLAWARRTLLSRLAAAPDDCRARAWLAWVLYLGGDLEAAREQLDQPGCPTAPPDRARYALLRAVAAREEGDAVRARAALVEARDAEALYEEDRALVEDVTRSLWPGREPPLFARGEVEVGWTTNPLLGSPLDPRQRAADTHSSVLGFRGTVRLGHDLTDWLRPFAQADLKAVTFSSEPAHELSYVAPGGRAGVVWGLGGPTLTTAYHYDVLVFAGGDRYGAGPMAYYEGHRGEVELTLGPELTIFGGVGHREFRPMARTRWEADLGVGGGIPLGERLFLLSAISGRAHRASNEAYDLWGGTALASLQVNVHDGWSLRGRGSISVEVYPDSRGYFAADADRRDVLVRASAGVWTPRLGSGSLGLVYEPSWRFSTAEAYSFDDHRVLLRLQFTFSGDPWLPAGVAPEGHVRLPYGLEGGEAGVGERIRELLRQDEESQRGSSCVE